MLLVLTKATFTLTSNVSPVSMFVTVIVAFSDAHRYCLETRNTAAELESISPTAWSSTVSVQLSYRKMLTAPTIVVVPRPGSS